MQIIQGTTAFEIEGRSAVAIGKFDGIHEGHRLLLSHILKERENGRRSVVFTFDPPASVFFGKSGEGQLTTRREKRQIFAELGIDVLVEFPLTAETAAISPEKFIEEILCGQLHAAYVAAGTDLSFGYRGQGNQELLQKMTDTFGYEVDIVDKIRKDGREISSSYVREEIEQGHMEMAAELLGSAYEVSGVVEEGKRLGRRLGMPTLNLYPEKDKLLPPRGVYYSMVFWDGREYPGITNIGHKPTVNNTSLISVETYLYDFKEDMYGKEIRTALLHFKRPEQRFGSVEELKAQMEKDIAAGRIYHKLPVQYI